MPFHCGNRYYLSTKEMTKRPIMNKLLRILIKILLASIVSFLFSLLLYYVMTDKLGPLYLTELPTYIMIFATISIIMGATFPFMFFIKHYRE